MRFFETLVPPPVVATLAAALMWVIAGAWPELRVDIPAARWVALALAAPGLLLDFAGVLAFLRARTTVNPMRPHKARELVTGGLYAWTRNPMYLGWIPILAGWAIYLEHPLTLLVVPLFVAYLTRFQIIPEERALAAAFGAEFDRYARRVRRWV